MDAQSTSRNDISTPNTSLSALNKSSTPPIKQNHTQNNHSKATPSPKIQSPPSAATSTNPQNGKNTFPQQLPVNPDISKMAKNMDNFSVVPTKKMQKKNHSTQVPNVKANLQTTSRQAKSTPPNLTKHIPPLKAKRGSTKQIPNAAGKPLPYSGQRQDKKTFKGASNSISIITEKPKPPNQLIARVAPSTPFSSSISYAAICAGNAPGTYQAHQTTQRVVQSPIFNLNYQTQAARPVQVAHSRSRAESRSVVPVATVKENISHILKLHHDGIPILKLQKVYLFKFGKTLSPCGYSTLRHFLVGMSDVVQIKGVGVQTLVFSVSSEIVSSAAKEQHDSYLLYKNKSLHHDKMLPASNTSPISLHCQEGYIAEDPQNVATEQTGALSATERDPHLLSTSTVSHLTREQEHPKEEDNHDITEKDVINQDQQIVIELSDEHLPEGSLQTELLSNNSLHNPSVVHPAMENQKSTEVTTEKNMQIKTDFPFSEDQQLRLILHSSGFSVVKQETNNKHELPYESSLHIQIGHESQLNSVHDREKDTDRMERHTCVQDVLPKSQSQKKTLNAHESLMPEQRDPLASNLQENVYDFHMNAIAMEKQIPSSQEINHNAGYSNAGNTVEQPFSFPIKKDQKEDSVPVNGNGKPSLLSQIHQTPCSQSINIKVCDPQNIKANGDNIPPSLPANIVKNHWSSESPNSKHIRHAMQHLTTSREEESPTLQTDQVEKNHSISDTMGQTVNVCSETHQQVSNGNAIESDNLHKKQETGNSIVKKKPRRRRSRSTRARQKANEVPADTPESSSCSPPYNESNACKKDKPKSTSDKHQSRSPSVGNNNANIVTPEKAQDQFMTSCTSNLTEETPSSSVFAFQKMHMETRHLNSNMLQQIQYTKTLDVCGKSEQVHDPLNKKAPGEKDPSCLHASMNNFNRDKSNGSSEPTTLDTHQTYHHLYLEKIPGEKASPSSETDKGKKNLSTTDTMAQTVNLCSETNQQISKLTIHKCQENNSSIVKNNFKMTKFLHRFFKSSPACPKTKGILGDAPQSLHCPASHQNGLISKAESTVSYSTVHQGVSQDFCNHKVSNETSTLAKTQVLTEQTPACPKTKGILGDAPQSLYCPASHQNRLISKAESTVSYSMVHQGVSQDSCNNKASNGTSTLAKTQVLTEQTPACPKTKGILGIAPQSLHCPASHQNGLISKAESTLSYSMVHQGVSQDLCNHRESNTASTLAKTQVLTEQTLAWPKTKGILGAAPQSLHCPAFHLNGLISKAKSTVSYSMVHQGVSQDVCNHRASNRASTLAKTQIFTEQTLACPKTKGLLGDAPQSLYFPASRHNGLISKAESTVSYSTVPQGVSQDLCNHKASNRASTLAKTQVLTEQTPSLLPPIDPTPKDVSTWQNPSDASEKYCCIL
ncbi:uncharacterized protein LOC108696783 isoform X2 [Xenopus laevis]|uniref:Uncharacterized protein LOC108696783 isoform X2 n=1 Tax=Xenopus laevis TaxID=8355 RepID=A0A8J0T9X5_XENLA|nr:uncharacterized protein LOC108696783 isoform X2 [Xenopus laevis]